MSRTVTFETEYGTIDPVVVPSGSLVERPEDPVKDGFFLSEWYREPEFITPWDFEDDIVDVDIILYARWIDKESLNTSSILSFSELSEMEGDELLYSVKKVDNKFIDFNLKSNTLKSFIIGDTEIMAADITPDSHITIRNPAGMVRLSKVSEFEKRIFGNEEISINKDTKFRIFRNDGVRGFTTLAKIKSELISDDVEVNEVTTSTNIRFLVNNENKYIKSDNFLNWITGNDVFATVENDDRIHISSNTRRGTVRSEVLTNYILPNREITSESEINDNLKIYAKSSSRGHISLKNIKNFTNKDIPKYTGGDNVSENVTFLYRDGQTHGYLTMNKLIDLVHKNQVEVISESTVFRTVNGVISYNAVKEDFYNKVSETFKTTTSEAQTDINDGDGILFVSNGGITGKHKNVSYLTIKNKILADDTPINLIQPGDRLLIIRDGALNGHVTYSNLLNQLRDDI